MNETWIAAIHKDYGLAAPLEIKLLQDGQAGNKTYLADSNGRKTILKIYGEYWLDKIGWIENELEFLLFLAENDLSVGAPISRADGGLLGVVETPEGSRPYAAFTFAEGTAQWPLSETRSRSLGAALAQMHLAASGFRARLPWREYDVTRLVDLPLARMLSYLGDRPEVAALLVSLAERIKVYLARIPTASSEYGPIHGDIHQGNVHFNTDGDLTFFDFSLCGIGWRAYDFTGFLWPMRDKTIEKPAMRLSCESFLAGYRSVRQLSAAEEAAIPAFIKVRDFWETGDWLECGRNLDLSVVEEGIVCLVERFEATPLEAL